MARRARATPTIKAIADAGRVRRRSRRLSLRAGMSGLDGHRRDRQPGRNGRAGQPWRRAAARSRDQAAIGFATVAVTDPDSMIAWLDRASQQTRDGRHRHC